MRDSRQAGKQSGYVTNHPGQLSLAIPPWVGAMSTSESWDLNRHTVRCAWYLKLWMLIFRYSVGKLLSVLAVDPAAYEIHTSNS